MVHSFQGAKTAPLQGTVFWGHPGTDPSTIFLPAAEPTRQPTTKRRKRKNSTSSTSNSSAGNNANSTGSKKKTPAANLSLSSQVPVSLAFLLGLTSCLCLSPESRGPQESLFALPRPGWGGAGGGEGREELGPGNHPLQTGN